MNKLFLIVFCSLLLVACGKETQTNVIQGKLFNNCQREALGDVEILLLNKDNQGKPIAADVTARDGSFNLNYDMEEDKTGSVDLSFFNGSFYETVLPEIPLNESYSLDIVVNNTSSVIVEVQVNSTLENDTLLYSINASNNVQKIIQPSDGRLDTSIHPIATSILNTEEGTLYWGLGQADFQIASEALELADSSYHHIPIKLNGCGLSEKATIIIE